MKIILNTSGLIDDILADSALNAIFNHDSALLTPDHRPALINRIATAASSVAGELGGLLESFTVADDRSSLTFDIGYTEASPSALEFHLSTAISFAALRLTATSIGDIRRADVYRTCLRDTLATLLTVISAPPRRLTFRPCYY